MSKSLLSFATVLAAVAISGSASAETYDANEDVKPTNGYVSVGADLGIDRAIKAGVYIDGGKRIEGTPLFVRGQLTGGKSGSEGSYTQFRAGIEARGCVVRNFFCAFVGTDAGYQRDHMIDQPLFSSELQTVDAHDVIAVPRLGLEAGRKIQLRTAVEMPLYLRLNSPADHMSDWSDRGAGLTLSFAVAGAF